MLADKQMEIYRTIAYSCIYLTSATGDTTYFGDSAYSACPGDRFELLSEHDGHRRARPPRPDQ